MLRECARLKDEAMMMECNELRLAQMVHSGAKIEVDDASNGSHQRVMNESRKKEKKKKNQ